MLIEYGSKDLKEQFKELEGWKNSTLVPIFNSAINGFMDDLVGTPYRYGVSDFKRIKEIRGHLDPSYHLVVDGKIISMLFCSEDIDTKDDDESWWMIGKVKLDGCENEVKTLVSHLKEYMRNQCLDGLIEDAREELKKGKTYHLSPEMHDLYLTAVLIKHN